MESTCTGEDVEPHSLEQDIPYASPQHPRSVASHDGNDTEKKDVSNPAETHEYPSGIAKALILGSVTLIYFLFFLDLAVVSTATPAITSDLKSLVDVGWYGGAYQLGSSALQPLTGKIYRYFSTKARLLIHFQSTLCATTHDLDL